LGSIAAHKQAVRFAHGAAGGRVLGERYALAV